MATLIISFQCFGNAPRKIVTGDTREFIPSPLNDHANYYDGH
jgi:hypothetical protein